MKLGRYEIVRELGKGAMGIVYLAKDPLIGRLVALKTIRAGQHADDDETKEFQQRFIREAQAAGILNHPSIVTVHDIGQDEATGMSFIAMEYVEGQNLKEVLSQGRALSFEQIGDIVAQVADGLDFAHSKGIVHRDVKPANIILLEGLRAKITDFGIAKIASGAANLTTTGQFLGTPNYMAPEQIKGAQVDGRTDIFSLGICLYECLTRRKPFGGDSLTSISYKIVHEPFPPLHEINPQIPEGFEEVVANCLQKDPAKRYQRGKELATSLRAVMRGERPTRSEPLLADETVVTRDRDKIPTIEIPFPDVPDAAELSGTQQRAAAANAAAAAAAVSTQPAGAKAPAAPRAPRPQLAKQLKNTLTNVRSSPAWKRRISPPIFIGIIIVLIAALAGTAAMIRKSVPPVPHVDSRVEARRAQERRLRQEGNELLRQGNTEGAYQKFEELNRIAPGSPAVAALVQKLGSIRQQEMISKQQLGLAQQKFDQGMALYNEKKFAEAIPLFEEAFHLNPSSEPAANYLKLAQQEQQKAEEAKNARKSALTRVAATNTAGHQQQQQQQQQHAAPAPVNNSPAQLTTVFNPQVADGYLTVKFGGQVIVYENLFEEKGRFIRRKQPRLVNATKEVTPANGDLEVWVVIPSLNIKEHHTIPFNLQPGSQHKLLVLFDAQSKKFDYQMN